MVMATSLINQIQKHHHKDTVWLTTSPAYIEIFKHNDRLKIMSFDRKYFLNNLKIVFWIRKMKFDRLYDLQSNDRTSVICAFSGAKEIIGNHSCYPYKIHPADKYTGQCHIYDRMLQVLSASGINAVHEPPSLPASDNEKKHVIEWLEKHELQHGKAVIIHAGASINHPEKCWPHFNGLAKKLVESGYKIIWTGSQADKAQNTKLAESTGIDASGEFSIVELAELGRYVAFAVTNDSGPMHILSASGIPVFAFFGPTNWRRNHAIDQSENVICANNDTTEEFTPAPLGWITVDQAESRIREKGLL